MMDSADRQAITGLFSRYVAAFQGYEAEEAVGCYQMPAMIVDDHQSRLFELPSELAAYFQGAFEDMKGRGFRSVEWTDQYQRILGPRLALVTIAWCFHWKQADQHIGATYLLRKTFGSWRIVVATLHPCESVSSFDQETRRLGSG